MLLSQIFILAAIALCSNKSKPAALVNLIITAILNTLLFFRFNVIHGEGRRLFLMFSIIFVNGCQGAGVLLFSLVKGRKQN